mmetsp:Transcript_13195/g.55236  ORF Transcript_13195/g.55236 Transcript_13195/m.55236 type:complete len:301 (-) Transcript_13195:2351-3253(-)
MPRLRDRRLATTAAAAIPTVVIATAVLATRVLCGRGSSVGGARLAHCGGQLRQGIAFDVAYPPICTLVGDGRTCEAQGRCAVLRGQPVPSDSFHCRPTPARGELLQSTKVNLVVAITAHIARTRHWPANDAGERHHERAHGLSTENFFVVKHVLEHANRSVCIPPGRLRSGVKQRSQPTCHIIGPRMGAGLQYEARREAGDEIGRCILTHTHIDQHCLHAGLVPTHEQLGGEPEAVAMLAPQQRVGAEQSNQMASAHERGFAHAARAFAQHGRRQQAPRWSISAGDSRGYPRAVCYVDGR